MRDLIGWWKFDEASGNIAYDSSGYNHHGNLFGGPAHAPGRINNALSFDGTDDYVSSSIPSVPKIFTIESWIYPTQSGREQHIAEFTNTQFYVGGNNRLGTPSWSNVWGNTTLSMNNWYHVVCVRDSTEVRLYLNGNLDGSGGSLGTNPSSPFAIGDLYGHGGNYKFKGLIDEVRIYNRALSAEEVLALFQDL